MHVQAACTEAHFSRKLFIEVSVILFVTRQNNFLRTVAVPTWGHGCVACAVASLLAQKLAKCAWQPNWRLRGVLEE